MWTGECYIYAAGKWNVLSHKGTGKEKPDNYCGSGRGGRGGDGYNCRIGTQEFTLNWLQEANYRP